MFEVSLILFGYVDQNLHLQSLDKFKNDFFCIICTLNDGITSMVCLSISHGHSFRPPNESLVVFNVTVW